MGNCRHHGIFEGLSCPGCAALERQTKELKRLREEMEEGRRVDDEREERTRKERREDAARAAQEADEQRWLRGEQQEEEREERERDRKKFLKKQKEEHVDFLQQQEKLLQQQKEQVAEDHKIRSQGITETARQLYNIGLFSEAAGAGRQALQVDGGNIEAYIITSHALTKLGFATEAQPLYEKQITLLRLPHHRADELALQIFYGLPPDKPLVHSFSDVVCGIAVGWPLQTSAPLLKAMFKRGVQDDARALLRALLSKSDSRFEECMRLLGELTSVESASEQLGGFPGQRNALSSSDLIELLPVLLSRGDLVIHQVSSFLRQLISTQLFAEADAKILVAVSLSSDGSWLAECIPLLNDLIEYQLLTAAEAKHLLAAVISRALEPTSRLEPRACANLLDTMITAKFLSREDGKEICEVMASKNPSRLADCLPLFDIAINRALDRSDAIALFERLVASTDLSLVQLKSLCDTAIREDLLGDGDKAEELLRTLLLKDDSGFSEGAPLLGLMVKKGQLTAASATALLKLALPRRKIEPGVCLPAINSIFENELFTQPHDAKELLQTLLSAGDLGAPEWIPLLDGLVTKGLMESLDVTELVGILLSRADCRLKDLFPLLSTLISGNRVTGAQLIIKHYCEHGGLCIENGLRLEAFSLEAGGRQGEIASESLTAFLRSIPYTKRRDVGSAFRLLATDSKRFSRGTIAVVKKKIAERYREWRPEIEGSLFQAAQQTVTSSGLQMFQNVLSAAKKTFLGSPAKFGCAVGILWLAAIVEMPTILPRISSTASSVTVVNALVLLGLFSPIAGALAGGLRYSLLRKVPFRDELDRLKSVEASEWHYIVGTRRGAASKAIASLGARPAGSVDSTTITQSTTRIGWFVGIILSGSLLVLLIYVNHNEPGLEGDVLMFFLLVPMLVWIAMKISESRVPSLFSLSLFGVFSLIIIGSAWNDWKHTRPIVLKCGEGAGFRVPDNAQQITFLLPSGGCKSEWVNLPMGNLRITVQSNVEVAEDIVYQKFAGKYECSSKPDAKDQDHIVDIPRKWIPFRGTPCRIRFQSVRSEGGNVRISYR